MDGQSFSHTPPASPRKYPDRWVPKVGDVISWNKFNGEHHKGKVIEMDSNVANVLCEDGKIRCVEC